MITLFESSSTDFTTNGMGNLPDAASCTVVEERNGKFELEMKYPITGRHYSDLKMRNIIVAKPNPYANPQPFRIYSLEKPINGMVTVNAEHISYDLSGYPVSPFSANTVTNAFINMKEASAVPCPFSFSTDKTTSASMSVKKPSSIRSLLGGVQGSILDVYGGEYEFDGFLVKLHNHRGNEKADSEAVSIRYGKNLTDIQQEENCSSVFTGVYPFWYSDQEEGGGFVELSEKVVKAEGTYDFTRISPLDLSQEWQEMPTQAQLREKAKAYMKSNQIGVPKVSLTVSFVQLAQSEEYKDYALLETVHLCDMVVVQFPELGVDAKAKCISTTYNVLTGKYDKLELGDARSNLASTVTAQAQNINETAEQTKTFLERAIETATQLISGGLGGYVVMHSSANQGHPDEILIMDTDNIQTATHVWRWNQGGLGYSGRGYNGPYATAITQDGKIVADFITAGAMCANYIKGGTLTLGGKDNGNGKCQVKDKNDKVLVTLDDRGIVLSDDMKISYGNVEDTPNIPSKTSELVNDSGFKDAKQITQITKDTVTTSYINALNITAKEVHCESGDREANINGGYNLYKYKDKSIGHVGTNHWEGTEKYGLMFDLDMDGNYMGWGRKVDESGNYIVCLHYSRDDNMLHAGTDIDMRGYKLKNVSFENGGVTAEIHFVQVKKVNQDGTVAEYGTDAMLKFVNGILVDIRYYA